MLVSAVAITINLVQISPKAQRLQITLDMNGAVSRLFVRKFGTTSNLCSLESTLTSGFYNSEQLAIQESVKKLLDETINPNWKQWQDEQQIPAKKIFRKFGDAGLLGIHKDQEYGGQGLTYKHHMAFCEAMGHSLR